MSGWGAKMRIDPVKPLLNYNSPAIRYYARRDLLGEDVEPIQTLRGQPEAKKLLRNQRGDGSWVPAGKNWEKYPAVKYGLIETFRRLRELVGKYELDRTHPAVDAAAEYVFTCQTGEDDFRGFYADQYAPHYTGLLTELLTKAGYGEDPRVEKAIRWLIGVRQRDGGWLYPPLGAKLSWKEQVHISCHNAEVLPFDPSHPSSHNVTGMALRGPACHPRFAHMPEAKKAGELLASRFFQPDAYKSYEAADNWVRFQYPYWWNNLVMALDSLSRIGFTADHPKVREGLDWLDDHQSPDGLWENSYRKGAKKIETEHAAEGKLWVSLAICRVFKTYEKKG